MTALYCCGNFAEHVDRHNCMGVVAKANALGFRGPAYKLDTAFLKPKDGVYVQVTSRRDHVSPCVVEYLKHEHMSYEWGKGPTVNVRGKVKNAFTLSASGKQRKIGRINLGWHKLDKAVEGKTLQKIIV
jgi:hypothetical protein